MTWNAWVNLVVGILLIISPFALGFSGDTAAMWSSIIGGAVVAIVAGLQVVLDIIVLPMRR